MLWWVFGNAVGSESGMRLALTRGPVEAASHRAREARAAAAWQGALVA